MVNTTLPELRETEVKELPPADVETLLKLRQEACSTAASEFKLQPQQRFLRRVLSPDAPTQGLLMVHGTGTGKTCTGIQIAEEYILRPEFQNKKVFVLASPAVQDNFRHQIFDASQVKVDETGITLSKQCTGRRYLDIIQRTKAQSLSWSTQAGREGIMRSASKIIDEFYEFWGYEEFGNELERQTLKRNTRELDAWIRATYDNRLIIIDEAHNLRDTSETTKNEKIVNAALRRIIQTANGITLVLLTATPMYDTFDEIIEYFNMFLWNERKQTPSESLKTLNFFTKNGDFVSEDARAAFHKLSNTYISYVKGENPFTFPFRLDPPADMLASIARTHDMDGKRITNPIKYLKLSQAIMSPYQSGILRAIRNNKLQEPRVVCVLPDNKNALRDVMDKQGNQWKYSGIPFLSKSNVATYSAKFASILRCISESQGIVLVYSNIVDLGAQLFAMCLEEHGFSPAFGEPLMSETSGEVQARTSGTYALFTSNTSRADIKTSLGRLKQIGNKDGKDIRVIIASPKVSEGVDFKYVRQIHVLDPWYNMSRIEQVIGRGLRTCSHAALHPLEQNCTVYLHVNRHPGDTQEVLDEYIYREFVEKKAIRMAKVKKALMESAMDCKLEQSVNSLPKEWLDLQIRQTRAQRNETITEKLRNLTAPVFMNDATFTCDDIPEVEDTNHTRPLSAILDVKDEILDKLMQLFADKPVWKHKDLLLALKPYDDSLIRYILQNAIAQGFKMRDKNGRVGRLEAKKGLYAFAVGDNDTMLDRLIERTTSEGVSLSDNMELKIEEEPVPEPPAAPVENYAGIETEVNKHVWTPMALNYSYEIREWYYVDQLMNPDARREHILNSLNGSGGEPPEYLKSMVIETPQRFYVFGPDEFYTPDKAKFVPIGPSLDAYKAWRNNLKDRFVAGKDNFFAAMKGNTLQFNVDDKKVPAERAERTKVIGGRSCAFFEEKVLTSFAKWFGSTLEKMKKQDRCIEISMLARKASLEGKPGFDWYTPEEWAVLTEESTRKEVLARLNPKKKK
jgi:superfamily II DNA or RNA helicase